VPDRAGTQFPHDESVHAHPGIAAAVAKEKTFKATGINIIGAAMDVPFNTMGGGFLLEAPSSHSLR